MYYKLRGRPNDPTNLAAAAQSEALSATISVTQLLDKSNETDSRKSDPYRHIYYKVPAQHIFPSKRYAKPRGASRGVLCSRCKAKAHCVECDVIVQRAPKPKPAQDMMLVTQINSRETILQRVQNEIYRKRESEEKSYVDMIAELTPEPSWEEKAAKLLQEIFDDDLNVNKTTARKTIEETQREVDTATAQLHEINKLIEAQNEPSKSVKPKWRKLTPAEKIMQMNVRRGWEWIPNNYLDSLCKNSIV